VGEGGGALELTVKQAENSEVFPCESVAVQLMIPLLIATGKSNGKLKAALPPPSVMTLGTLPVTSGLLACWLVVHCESALKYQCTVKVWFGALFSVPLTVTVTSGWSSRGLAGWDCHVPATEVNTGKFCWKFAPPSVSSKSFAVMPVLPRSIPSRAF
jgi:hypothetical protein